MGRMSREKGKRGEREVITILQPVVTELYTTLGLPAPVLKRNTLQCDGGGSDVAFEEDGTRGLAWLALEVKFHANPAVNTWWKQTLAHCGQQQTPVLIYRRNNVDWKVRMFVTVAAGPQAVTVAATVSLEDFLRYFRARVTHELTKQGD